MAVVLQPWQVLVTALAGWITNQQDVVIEYLQEENRVLKQQRGKALGRRALTEIVSLVTPDTILRWHRQLILSIKDECLNRMIFFGERSLRKATREFTAHYHTERNHRGLDNRLIETDDRVVSTFGPLRCVQRLGGTLRFYQRAAA